MFVEFSLSNHPSAESQAAYTGPSSRVNPVVLPIFSLSPYNALTAVSNAEPPGTGPASCEECIRGGFGSTDSRATLDPRVAGTGPRGRCRRPVTVLQRKS